VTIFDRILNRPSQLDRIEQKLETIVSNQETADRLAAEIAEDVEVLARLSDQVLNVNSNLQGQLKRAEDALLAAGVDFSPLQQSASQLDALAKVFSAAMSPEESTPPVDAVPEVVVTEPEPVASPVGVDPADDDGSATPEAVEPAPPAEATGEVTDTEAQPEGYNSTGQ
jgi:hypothetical protein